MKGGNHSRNNKGSQFQSNEKPNIPYIWTGHLFWFYFLGMEEEEDEAVPLPDVNAAILNKVIQFKFVSKNHDSF